MEAPSEMYSEVFPMVHKFLLDAGFNNSADIFKKESKFKKVCQF